MPTVYIWNKKIELYQEKIKEFILDNPDKPNGYGFEMVPDSISLNSLPEWLKKQKACALIHRNEHGILMNTKEWIQTINQCLSLNIPVLSFDFGYFDHYHSFMIDRYHNNGLSNIYSEWEHISPELDWHSFPEYIQVHRNKIIGKVSNALLEPPPLNLTNIVTIWGQWTTDLIREPFWEHGKPITQDRWIQNLIPLIKSKGFNPVVKMSPVKSLKWFTNLQEELPVFVGLKKHLEELPKAHYIKDLNYQLIAHSKYHIINCSSVSNELFLTGSKVIAMGRSWFNSLGVFHEPQNWKEVMEYKSPIEINKNKWANWWKKSQFEMIALPYKIIGIIQSYGNY